MKIPSLAALQVAFFLEQWSNVHDEPLKNRTYLGKKLFFNFLGADFLLPIRGHNVKNSLIYGRDSPGGILLEPYKLCAFKKC